MLGRSKDFIRIIRKYSEHETAEEILRSINIFENKLMNRVRLQNISRANFTEALNSSIEFIESSNSVFALLLQLSTKIKTTLQSKKRMLEITTLQRQNVLEISDMIKDIKTESKKQTVLKNTLRSEFLELEQEIEVIKEDFDAVELFITSTKDTKSLCESYYQAIKQINNIYC